MKDTGKSWLVKVVTDLGTRLLVIVEPHLLVKDLQGDLSLFKLAGRYPLNKRAKLSPHDAL